MTNWPEYRELDWLRIEDAMNGGGLLVDSWRIAGERIFERVNYTGLGLGEGDRAAVQSSAKCEKVKLEVSI
jgi:hypothetical protein